MLSQLGKNSQISLPSSFHQQRSPYLLQYKVFQQRLKRQQKLQKPNAFISRIRRKPKQSEDFLELTRNILSKKQNYNIFQDFVAQSEQTIESNNGKQELVAKTRELFENKLKIKRDRDRDKSFKGTALAELKTNSTFVERSRVKSEANTTQLLKSLNHSKGDVSFLGYKRNKKWMAGQGIRSVWGLN